MYPPPPRRMLPWYLRLGALAAASVIALYVVALYVYGIKFMDLVASLRPSPNKPVIAHDPPPAPSEPGVVMFNIGKDKPPGR